METTLEQMVIAIAETVKCFLKADLQANKEITAGGTNVGGFVPLAPQKVLGHGWNQGARQDIGSEHGEYDRLGERHEQVFGHPSEEEHGNEHDANCQRGYDGGSGYLGRTFQDNIVHTPVRCKTSISVDVLDFNSRVVYQDSDSQGQSPERLNVDGFA